MSARGGTSSFYEIYCGQCRKWILQYQKDGPGKLFRLYLDRIHAPENLTIDGGQSGGLSCEHCDISIGVPMIYKPEDRPAIRLISGATVKRKSDGSLPAQETYKIEEST